MSRFKVTWIMDIEGDNVRSHRDAAKKALDVHRNPESIATVFYVQRQHQMRLNNPERPRRYFTGPIIQVDLDEDETAPVVRCGHTACSQNYIDTGETQCIENEKV